MSGPPRWQRLIVSVERAAAPTLRAVTMREEFAVAHAIVRTVGAAIGGQAERTSRRALHLLNLPAASDVNQLLAQIASVERQVRELAKAEQDRHDGKGGDHGGGAATGGAS